jgi:hypothetical protein
MSKNKSKWGIPISEIKKLSGKPIRQPGYFSQERKMQKD